MRPIPAHAPLNDGERTLQWALFLLVLLANWHMAWLQHMHDPYEFLRHGTDSLGYYQWLPSLLIDGDWSRMYWTYQQESGIWISLFTIGVAVLELPFFLLGHWAAWTFGYDLNGFSSPYGVAIMLGTSLYAAAGCVLTFKLARRFSATRPALIAALVIYAGTNLLYYSVHQPMMSHLHSYFLITLYAWCALRVLDGPRPVHVAALVLSGSLLVLIRQLNVFVLLFPVLMGGWGALRLLTGNMVRHRITLIASLVLALAPWVLQMVYWHWATGEAITFTYGKKGEHFEFGSMVPGLVLFSPRNGWLVYTPLMIAVLAMLLRRAWQGVAPARSVLFLVVFTLIVYSAWWCWWLGGSFGHRGFVDLYGLLAIPLAWLMDAVLRRTIRWKLAAALALVAVIQLNLGLARRYQGHWSDYGWNWKQFFSEVSQVVAGDGE
ncbi:MAG: hypothetical protein IPM12_03330 [Flavobacteriales bacterium]|nr:hypothetical protein [Flavobacteriales bacterium]